jgi:hypothetical protein
MTIPELITLLQNQLATLNTAQATAVALGDIEHAGQIEAKAIETQLTLDALATLPG